MYHADMLGETYALSLVTRFLQQNNMEFEYNSAKVGSLLLYHHGCRVSLKDRYSLSIQTHPDIVGCFFAETALMDVEKKQFVVDGTLGYRDVMQFSTPDALREHLLDVIRQLS